MAGRAGCWEASFFKSAFFLKCTCGILTSSVHEFNGFKSVILSGALSYIYALLCCFSSLAAEFSPCPATESVYLNQKRNSISGLVDELRLLW